MEALLRMDFIYVLPSFALISLYLVAQNLKWKYMLRKQGIHLKFWELLRIYLIGVFYGSVTPGKIGTLIRIDYLRKKTGKDIGVCGVSVVMDKLLDILVIFSLAILGTLLIIGSLSPFLSALITISFITFLTLFFMFMKEGPSRRILRVFWRIIIPKSMKGKTREAYNSFYKNMLSWKDLMIPLFLTILGWILVYSVAFTLSIPLNLGIPYHLFILLFPIASIVGLIPITVSGFGTREATIILLFSLFGVPEETVFFLSLLTTLVSYLIPAGTWVLIVLSDRRWKRG